MIAHEGHLGMVRMKQRCREGGMWPGMDKQVENWVRDCEACLLSGKSVRPRVAPLQPVQWPAGPWDRIQIDIFGELHAASYSQRFMIVVHDLFSKWPEVHVVQNVTTATVIDFKFFSLYLLDGVCQVSLLPTIDHSSRRSSLRNICKRRLSSVLGRLVTILRRMEVLRDLIRY